MGPARRAARASPRPRRRRSACRSRSPRSRRSCRRRAPAAGRRRRSVPCRRRARAGRRPASPRRRAARPRTESPAASGSPAAGARSTRGRSRLPGCPEISSAGHLRAPLGRQAELLVEETFGDRVLLDVEAELRERRAALNRERAKTPQDNNGLVVTWFGWSCSAIPPTASRSPGRHRWPRPSCIRCASTRGRPALDSAHDDDGGLARRRRPAALGVAAAVVLAITTAACTGGSGSPSAGVDHIQAANPAPTSTAPTGQPTTTGPAANAGPVTLAFAGDVHFASPAGPANGPPMVWQAASGHRLLRSRNRLRRLLSSPASTTCPPHVLRCDLWQIKLDVRIPHRLRRHARLQQRPAGNAGRRRTQRLHVRRRRHVAMCPHRRRPSRLADRHDQAIQRREKLFRRRQHAARLERPVARQRRRQPARRTDRCLRGRRQGRLRMVPRSSRSTKPPAVRWQTGNDLPAIPVRSSPKLPAATLSSMFARSNLLAIDPEKGQTIAEFPWRASKLESVNASTPVVVGDEVFVSETYEVGSAVVRFRWHKVRGGMDRPQSPPQPGDGTPLEHADRTRRLPLRLQRLPHPRGRAALRRMEDGQSHVERTKHGPLVATSRRWHARCLSEDGAASGS